jgi:hypothetical protein
MALFSDKVPVALEPSILPPNAKNLLFAFVAKKATEPNIKVAAPIKILDFFILFF